MATGLGQVTLRASSPFWASEASLARFRETHLTRPNRRACSQARDKLFFFLEFNMMTVTLAETIRTPEENTCNTGHSYLCFFSFLVVSVLTYLLTKEDLTPEEVNGHVIDVVANGVDQVSVEKK